jgi:uncharacterized protein YndB with AHSA1/START domain
MARIEASIEIEASRTDVFRVCHDIDRRPDWDERVVNLEMITPPPIRRGSLVRIDAGRSGQFLYTWDAEYTNFRLPSGSAMRVIDAAPSSPFKSGIETWELSPTAKGTRVVLTWEYQPRGFISRVLDALGRRAGTRRVMQHSLENLKNLLETG